MRTLAILLLLAPVLADAESMPWMEKDDPDELFVNHGITSACSFSAESMQKTIDDVLVRSRIKPVDKEQDLNLVMDIQCKALSGEMYSTMLTADFYRVVKVGRKHYWARPGATRCAGKFGTGTGDAIIDAVQKLLEDVIADYLRANFDLSD